jgi:hypothetical protein
MAERTPFCNRLEELVSPSQGEWTGVLGSSQIDSRRRPLEMIMKRKRRAGSMSLWTIVESLQRRLERQGLAKDVIDAAVVTALAQAMNGAVRA